LEKKKVPIQPTGGSRQGKKHLSRLWFWGGRGEADSAPQERGRERSRGDCSWRGEEKVDWEMGIEEKFELVSCELKNP